VKKENFWKEMWSCFNRYEMIIACVLFNLLFSGCVMGTSSPKNSQHQEFFQIKNLMINDLPEVTEVVIQGEGPLFYRAIKVPESHQLILEIPGVTLGKHIKPMVVNRGAVLDIYPRETRKPKEGVQFEINLNPSATTRVRGEEGKIIVEIFDSRFSATDEGFPSGNDGNKLVSLALSTENDFQREHALAESGKDYLIGSEDVLEIMVWKNDVLSRTVKVRPDGIISFPLIGDVSAAGLKPNQLRERIAGLLKEYMENPVVTVIVQEINSYVVYLMGEVVNPGKYQLKSNVTVIQALALAGGFTQFASRNKIIILRKGYKEYPETKIKVKYDDIVSGGEMENIFLKPGDTILVP